MSLLSLENISHAQSGKELFKELNFGIEENARIGLVGANGSGKSTLLKIMAKRIEPDDGRIIQRKGLKVALVEQFAPQELLQSSIWEVVALNSAYSELGSAYDYLVDQTLEKLGFSAHRFNDCLQVLSGGEVNRVLLARALISEPDILFLDEPTNHMDIAAVLEFEELLKTTVNCAFCIVSHDRELLDHCTNQTIFLRDRTCSFFDLPYSQARSARDDADLAAKKRREDEEREIERLEASAKQLKSWAHLYGNEKFATRARSIERQIERNVEALTFVSHERRASLSLAQAKVESRYCLQWIEGEVSLGPILSPLKIEKFVIRPGERIALVAKNGTGKTSFLKRVVAEFSAQNRGTGLSFTPSLSLGYYDQNLSTLDIQSSVLSSLQSKINLPLERLTKELVRAGFPYERHGQRLALLSGGERARLRLLCLKLENSNLLLLDEPSNHLDLDGVEELELSLLESSTTSLMVSHDRRLVSAVANRFFTIRESTLFEVDISEIYSKNNIG